MKIVAFDYEITGTLHEDGLTLSNRDTAIYADPEDLPAVAAALSRWAEGARVGRLTEDTPPEAITLDITIQLEGGRVVDTCAEDRDDEHHADGGLDIAICATGRATGPPVFPPDGTNGYICMSPAQAAHLAAAIKSDLRWKQAVRTAAARIALDKHRERDCLL